VVADSDVDTETKMRENLIHVIKIERLRDSAIIMNGLRSSKRV
jgi:hypothetical protein